MAGLLRSLERWKSEAGAAGRTIDRVVLTYEAGRDGFWIARYLQARGIQVHVVHPATVPEPRTRRRAQNAPHDLDIPLPNLRARLRRRPALCSTVRVRQHMASEKTGPTPP